MSSILRAALRGWYALRLLALRAYPHPRDARVIRTGDPRADRVLVIGNGFFSGWGVEWPRAGAAGRLSDAVADRTGRGCDVEVIGADVMDARSALAWIGDRDLTDFDAVVVALGVGDALRRTPVADWQQRLEALFAGLTPRIAPHAPVLFVGIPPITALSAFHGIVARSAAGHRARLNAAGAYAAELAGLPHVDIAEFVGDARGRVSETSAYGQLATRLASELAPSLVAARPDPEPRAALECRSDVAELARLAATGSSTLRDVMARAEKRFRVEFATVSLLDGDRLHPATHSELASGPIPLALSFSRWVLESEGPVVVPDARVDPRFADNPLVDVAGADFFAGVPLRDGEGRVVGAFGLHGLRARPSHSVPLDALNELAREAEEELKRLTAATTARVYTLPSAPEPPAEASPTEASPAA